MQRYIREVTSNSKDTKTAKVKKKDRFRADWGIGGMGIARVLLFFKKCVNHDVKKTMGCFGIFYSLPYKKRNEIIAKFPFKSIFKC